jgi:hypothetical protein
MDFTLIKFCSNTAGKNYPTDRKAPLGLRPQEATEATPSLKPHDASICIACVNWITLVLATFPSVTAFKVEIKGSAKSLPRPI